jgi:hypothetical protein
MRRVGSALYRLIVDETVLPMRWFLSSRLPRRGTIGRKKLR